MPGKVLDSSALIAYFRDKAGAEEIEKMLIEANRRGVSLLMSEVNYA